MTRDAVLTQVAASDFTGRAFRLYAMRLLGKLEGYDWCGIYRLEGGELVLDEFVGEPTDHVRIPVGTGVCGTAVAENRNLIVEDVSQLSNYLACSFDTRAEIVVLIRDGARVLGQIDVDSHTPSAFNKKDEEFLQKLAEVLAARWL